MNIRDFLIICACLLSSINLYSQEFRFKAASVTDPMYEWSQYEEKDVKAKLGKDNTLVLENGNSSAFATSVMELPFSLDEEDFCVNLLMQGGSIKDDSTFGIIFNYKNEKNFAMLKFGQSQITIYEVERGEVAVIKRVIYKINDFASDLVKSDLDYKPDKKNLLVTIERKNGKIQFLINGLYVCSLKNYTINYPTFGFAAIGKNKINIYGLEFAKADSTDREE